MNNKQEYIICSAILKKESTKPLEIYHNSDLHKCFLGYRHADILHQNIGNVDKDPCSQGFYTSKNRFVNRLKTMKIAIEANQVKENELCNPRIGLFSEDIY